MTNSRAVKRGRWKGSHLFMIYDFIRSCWIYRRIVFIESSTNLVDIWSYLSNSLASSSFNLPDVILVIYGPFNTRRTICYRKEPFVIWVLSTSPQTLAKNTQFPILDNYTPIRKPTHACSLALLIGSYLWSHQSLIQSPGMWLSLFPVKFSASRPSC